MDFSPVNPVFPRQMLASVASGLVLALVVLALPARAQVGAVPASPSLNGLPHLGDVQGMSIAAERRLGDQIAQGIYRDPDYLDDPVLLDYLDLIWQPLQNAARARGDIPPELAERFAWELMISRERTVNAFALPGGYLGVHLGLLSVTDTPQELASVLAHELSHVSQRHIARLVSRQDRQAPWVLGAMILGALAAGSNPDAANAALAGSQAVAAQTQLNFSRDMEREADRVGFGVLTGAGFDGQGFVSMFDKLQQASRLNDDGSFPYLRSHPLTSERIADLRTRLPLSGGPRNTVILNPPARSDRLVFLNPLKPATTTARDAQHARALSSAPVLPSPDLHVLMAARARVLAENSSDRQRAWVQLGLAPKATAGELYAAALSAQRLGQRTQAVELAQRLQSAASGQARGAAESLLIEVLTDAVQKRSGGQGPDAEALRRLLEPLRDRALAGTSRAEVLLGAQAAMATGAPRLASERLQGWVVQHPRDAAAWQAMSGAAAAQGMRLRAVRAEAEAKAAQLDFAGAADRFKTAQALPAAERAADPIELAIVDTRRREVEAQLRESARDAAEN